MKKNISLYVTIGAMCVFILAVFIYALLPAPPPDENPELSDPFIGTWRDAGNESRIIVFHEDGTGLRGSTGIRFEITWEISDGVVRTSPFFGRLSFDNDTLTVRNAASPTGGATTDIYVFYSEATDLYEEESWFLYFVALPLLGIAIIILIRRERKKHSRPNRLGDEL